MARFLRFKIFSISLCCSAIVFSADCQNRPAEPRHAAPPTEKEIIKYVFQLAPLPLSKGSFCNDVGRDSSDKTIGDFIGSTWSYHADTSGKNFIKTECSPIVGQKAKEILAKIGSAAQDGPLWSIDFYICRRKDSNNEQWCWGIRFLVKQIDRTVVPGSITCLVAG